MITPLRYLERRREVLYQERAPSLGNTYHLVLIPQFSTQSFALITAVPSQSQLSTLATPKPRTRLVLEGVRHTTTSAVALEQCGQRLTKLVCCHRSQIGITETTQALAYSVDGGDACGNSNTIATEPSTTKVVLVAVNRDVHMRLLVGRTD